MENKEIIIQQNDNQNLMGFEADNILILAEQAEQRIAAVNKIMTAALAITNEYDWVLIGGKPYLQETGSTKVARLFGVKWEFLGEPKIETDKEGFKTFTYRMKFSMKDDSIECEGSRSTKDEFFSGKGDKKKSIDEIDERDVKMAAYTNCINNGIKRLIPGIRNITIKSLEDAGLDVSQIAGYTFKTGSKGGNSGKAEESGIKCEECGAGVTQTVASYAQAHFKKILCMSCQKKASDNLKNAETKQASGV